MIYKSYNTLFIRKELIISDIIPNIFRNYIYYSFLRSREINNMNGMGGLGFLYFSFFPKVFFVFWNFIK